MRLVDNADEDEKSQYSFSVTAIDEAGNVSDAQSVSLTVTPQSGIIVAHLGNSDHIRGVKIFNDNAVEANLLVAKVLQLISIALQLSLLKKILNLLMLLVWLTRQMH